MLILGLLFGCLSATFDSLGFVIQKKGHLEAAKLKKKYLKHPTWIIGLVTQISSVPFLMVALNLSSQTALSFIPALAIVYIVIWSRLILKVPLTPHDLLALAFTIPGILLIISFSTLKKVDLLSWETGDYIFSTQTILLMIIMLTLLIIGGFMSYKILIKFNMLTHDTSTENPNSGEIDAAQALPTKPDILEQEKVYLPLIYLPFFAGFTATFSNTCAKLNMNILHDDYLNHNEGDPKLPFFFALSFGLFNIFLIYSNLFYLNKCIQYFEPIYIIPIKKVALLVNNILCGGIILNEFAEYDMYMATGVITGAFLCAIGVSFFVQKRLVAINKNKDKAFEGLQPERRDRSSEPNKPAPQASVETKA